VLPGRKSQKDGVKLLVAVDVHAATLEADLTVPRAAQGIVLFAHGSGSSRFSPRNRQVASVLERAGMATFLLDLLTAEEEEADRATGHLRFNIPFLADRLVEATNWIVGFPHTSRLTVGYFGASTGRRRRWSQPRRSLSWFELWFREVVAPILPARRCSG